MWSSSVVLSLVVGTFWISLSAGALQCSQSTRRAFLAGSSAAWIAPQLANAGIDVSGLRVEGSPAVDGGNSLQTQLRAYDGSAATRVKEIKAAVASKPLAESTAPQQEETGATFALRYGEFSRLTRLGFGDRYRLDDYVVGSDGRSKVSVSFEFPSDWLQLDKLLGGIQYVDQRNGDKLYLLRTTLPEGTTLETVPKAYFGEKIFDQRGSIVRGGTNVDEFKVKQSVMVGDSNCRRRLTLKYATVTGNGLRVERRGLVDAQVIGRDVFMLMTSSNAVKFEAKGRERETVEAIVSSFRCDRV